ncbi:hypothetical protein BN11_2330008 [Nostocoides australiense Ben110]|uniref:Uncharacterized protein n=1 Tax=Nostocoides australiense Ben110 TaxID=1193182 RepID=W6JWG5_9MICO|nr:hypothetical protein BN11_2330008 [Tetrasphaera australiensis Ben110]
MIPASGVTGNGYHLVYDGRSPDVSPAGSKVLSAWADYATDDAGLATTNLSGGSLRIIADGVLARVVRRSRLLTRRQASHLRVRLETPRSRASA